MVSLISFNAAQGFSFAELRKIDEVTWI